MRTRGKAERKEREGGGNKSANLFLLSRRESEGGRLRGKLCSHHKVLLAQKFPRFLSSSSPKCRNSFVSAAFAFASCNPQFLKYSCRRLQLYGFPPSPHQTNGRRVCSSGRAAFLSHPRERKKDQETTPLINSGGKNSFPLSHSPRSEFNFLKLSLLLLRLSSTFLPSFFRSYLGLSSKLKGSKRAKEEERKENVAVASDRPLFFLFPLSPVRCFSGEWLSLWGAGGPEESLKGGSVDEFGEGDEKKESSTCLLLLLQKCLRRTAANAVTDLRLKVAKNAPLTRSRGAGNEKTRKWKRGRGGGEESVSNAVSTKWRGGRKCVKKQGGRRRSQSTFIPGGGRGGRGGVWFL